jgi:hemin uptake protein HemP
VADPASMDNHDSTNQATPDSALPDSVAPSSDQSLRTISSAELFHGAREVLIQHDEKTYRLQVTRNGKLILVK